MSTPVDPRRVQEVNAYGRSLLLDDGDLVLRDGSLAEVEGVENLLQGLQLRIATPWGNDRLNTTYGLDVTDLFTAGLPRSLAKEVLRLNLIRTLSGDPRVAAVDQVTFDDDPGSPAAASAPPSSSRVAIAEITVQPVSPVPTAAAGPSIGAAALAAAASAGAGDQGLGTVTLLTDVRL